MSEIAKSLTERQRDIMELYAKGSLDRQVAESLCISLNTVKHHKKNINQSLNTRTFLQAMYIFTVNNR